jgi:hypothetical protein
MLLVALMFSISALTGAAIAGPASFDQDTGVDQDYPPGAQGVAKVRPSSAKPLKVKPYGLSSAFGSLSGFNPATWGAGSCLPGPAKRQFVVGTSLHFAKLTGEVKKGRVNQTGQQASTVDFNDHLGLKKSGNVMWSLDVHYQFRPRWGFKYSFAPVDMDATHTPQSSFTFMDRSFTGTSRIRTKWERQTHKVGLVFNLNRRLSNNANFYVDWVYVQDKLSVGEVTGTATSVTLDDSRSLMGVGVEFQRSLKNYRGNTLAIGCKGGLVFLDNHIGYDAEAGLSYLIPIKRGRFGFLKGGYKYAHLKKDKDAELFSTSTDGAFIQVGFIF